MRFVEIVVAMRKRLRLGIRIEGATPKKITQIIYP
jgi:hypothetical protein